MSKDQLKMTEDVAGQLKHEGWSVYSKWRGHERILAGTKKWDGEVADWNKAGNLYYAVNIKLRKNTNYFAKVMTITERGVDLI